MLNTLVLSFLCLCAPYYVFCGRFFGKEERYQPAEGEIEQECLDKATAGDCEFYTCFDRRHPCTRHNYALSYGWRYCPRFDNHMDEFTDEGKRWITCSRQCSMEKMAEFYSADEISCTEVESEMKAMHAECDAACGICDTDMLMENREPLGRVYQFGRRTVIRMMFLVKECGEEAMDTVRDLVMEQAVPNIRDFFGRIINPAKKMHKWVKAQINGESDTADLD